VLLSYEGAVKLTDFGIAKASNRASTAGMLKGKFAYMSRSNPGARPVDPGPTSSRSASPSGSC
jgi:serine/threonine-protein kinase